MSTVKTSRLKAKDPIEAEPSKPKILMFGKPGVGKTWGSLDFPSVYYIDTEGGANRKHYTEKLKASGGQYMGPEDGALDFPTVIEQFQALATEKHNFKTVVVDSISKLFNVAVNNEAERLGEKNAFGADKKPAIAFMRRLVAWASKLDMNVIFIAHAKSEWATNAKGDRVEIGDTFDCWEKLEYELDLVFGITKQGPQRTARVRKSRLTGFPDGSTFPWAYAEFAERYGKDIIESEVHTIELATPEQVTEIERLLTIVKVEQSTVDKWKTKAGADQFSEFKKDQADAVIASLNKQINPSK